MTALLLLGLQLVAVGSSGTIEFEFDSSVAHELAGEIDRAVAKFPEFDEELNRIMRELAAGVLAKSPVSGFYSGGKPIQLRGMYGDLQRLRLLEPGLTLMREHERFTCDVDRRLVLECCRRELHPMVAAAEEVRSRLESWVPHIASKEVTEFEAPFRERTVVVGKRVQEVLETLVKELRAAAALAGPSVSEEKRATRPQPTRSDLGKELDRAAPEAKSLERRIAGLREETNRLKESDSHQLFYDAGGAHRLAGLAWTLGQLRAAVACCDLFANVACDADRTTARALVAGDIDLALEYLEGSRTKERQTIEVLSSLELSNDVGPLRERTIAVACETITAIERLQKAIESSRAEPAAK